jgi:hypothetical protein
MTRHILTAVSLVLTVGATVALAAATNMSILSAGADTTIAAWALCAEVLMHLTMFAHPAWLAIAAIVIDKLAAVSRTMAIAGIGQTLVDIPLTAWSCKTWRALALKSAHPVNTDTTVVAGTFIALVHIDFTEFAPGAWWA